MDLLIPDCYTTRLSAFRNAQRPKILFTPDQARHGHNNIVLEHSGRDKLGNQTPMQFLELGLTFAGENSCR